MRLFRPCIFSRVLYPEAVFRIKGPGKHLYLSFDDGPDPDSTPELLDILRRKEIKAVFFCNGDNAEKYPNLVDKIRLAGHTLGNHGFKHISGFRACTKGYVRNVERSAACTSGELFRPPYGHLTPRQYRTLKKNYKIVFWELMPYDFDPGFSSEKVLQVLKNRTRPGSIIVLHDSPGSCAADVLASYIDYAIGEGYGFSLF